MAAAGKAAIAHRHRLPCPTLTSPTHFLSCFLPRLPLKQKAEEQLDAAIAYKKAFLDGYLGKSALAQLRAKLAADYLIAPVK